MTRASVRSILIALPVAALVCAGACRAPTQVTLDVRYHGACSELNGGVGIAVGSDPVGTEARSTTGFFTAIATSCAPDGHIGTLVLTPGDGSDRASVIVAAGLAGTTTERCVPPDYEDCVVARRSVVFSDHAGLVLPVVLEPDCKNVPCSAISTCRAGGCVSSEVSCEGDQCVLPPDARPVDAGALADGPVAADGGDAASMDGALVDADASDGGTTGTVRRLACVLDDGGTELCTLAEDCWVSMYPTQRGCHAPGVFPYGYDVACFSDDDCSPGSHCCEVEPVDPNGSMVHGPRYACTNDAAACAAGQLCTPGTTGCLDGKTCSGMYGYLGLCQ